MIDQNTRLSPRHERFVLEYLRDGNATQAYIRAGYSPRGAQPSASRLLRQPQIAAAVAAGQRRVAETLEVSVERLAREYAKIAFANVADFVSTDADGGLRIDLDKASDAQRAGIVELKLSHHGDPEKRQVTLKLGKLQALAALTKNIGLLGKKAAPGLTPEDRERYERRHAADRAEVESCNDRYWKIQEKLRKTESTLAWAEYKLLAAERRLGTLDTPKAEPAKPPAPPQEQPPILLKGPGPHVAGAANGTISWSPTSWSPTREPPTGPTWHDITRQGVGFPGGGEVSLPSLAGGGR